MVTSRWFTHLSYQIEFCSNNARTACIDNNPDFDDWLKEHGGFSGSLSLVGDTHRPTGIFPERRYPAKRCQQTLPLGRLPGDPLRRAAGQNLCAGDTVRNTFWCV
jgi:hypothetical protein